MVVAFLSIETCLFDLSPTVPKTVQADAVIIPLYACLPLVDLRFAFRYGQLLASTGRTERSREFSADIHARGFD